MVKSHNIDYETRKHGQLFCINSSKDIVEMLEKMKLKPTSMIDISDGLLADLSHILRASKVGAEIDLAHIPLSKELLSAVDHTQALQLALQAGDDYKLCFTSSTNPQQLTLEGVFCIGCITENTELTFKNKPHNFEITTTGFDHFS